MSALKKYVGNTEIGQFIKYKVHFGKKKKQEVHGPHRSPEKKPRSNQ